MNKRYEKLAYLIAKKKAKPLTFFEQTFIEVKKQSKEYAEKLANKAIILITNTLKESFKKQGYHIEVSAKLGKFRGHLFVTSAIILLDDKLSQKEINGLLEYLITHYSPKYKYKGVDEDGKHKFNIR